MATDNPYAMTGKPFYEGQTSVNQDKMGPNADYAMPADIGDSPYAYEGWAPQATGELGGYPDPFRTGRMPEQGYDLTGRVEVDETGPYRNSQEADEGPEPLTKGRLVSAPKEFAPSPYANPQDGTRWTQLINPDNYGYQKPLDVRVRGEMHLTGERFSLAEFKRDYPSMLDEPMRPLRNTYRLEPKPWDRDIVDVPVAASPAVEVNFNGGGVPNYGGGSYRL